MQRIASEGTPSRGWLSRVGVVGTVLMAVPQLAAACAVCYGEVDSAMTEGMNNGILALLGFVAVVQVGFVALFLRFRHRSKKLADMQREPVRGGTR